MSGCWILDWGTRRIVEVICGFPIILNHFSPVNQSSVPSSCQFSVICAFDVSQSSPITKDGVRKNESLGIERVRMWFYMQERECACPSHFITVLGMHIPSISQQGCCAFWYRWSVDETHTKIASNGSRVKRKRNKAHLHERGIETSRGSMAGRNQNIFRTRIESLEWACFGSAFIDMRRSKIAMQTRSINRQAMYSAKGVSTHSPPFFHLSHLPPLYPSNPAASYATANSN